MTYIASPIRNFESYLRIGRFLNEDDIQLFLKQNISKFVTYEIPARNYTIKNISEIAYTKGDRAGSLQLEYDDISMKKSHFKTFW